MTGKAYAFFDCSASKNEIEAELPTVRRLAQTPNQLEISLTEEFDKLKGDWGLVSLNSIAKHAKKMGLRYLMEATYPNATNKATADELAIILNQAYQSPLSQNKEPFRGEIIYKGKIRYIFRQ